MKERCFPDPCMQDNPHLTQEDRDLVIAILIMSLIQGETLHCRMIRTDTMKDYLRAFEKLFVARQLDVPTKEVTISYANTAIRVFERWQKLPKRREPLSDEMCADLFQKGMDDHPDGRHAVVADFVLLGRYLAFRLSEFAQESQQTIKLNEKANGGDGSPCAFTFQDIDLFASKKTRRKMSFNQTKNLKSDDTPDMVSLTWRFQKNSQNGQKISLVKDDLHPNLCPVRAAVRIKQRAIRHNQTAPDQPVAFFIARQKQCYLTGDVLKRAFQASAKEVEGIDDPDLLSRFSAHSIRVTAANLLHRAGKSPLYIQLRCRWQSQTFMMYLRNTIDLAEQHTMAVYPTESLQALNLVAENIPDIQAPAA